MNIAKIKEWKVYRDRGLGLLGETEERREDTEVIEWLLAEVERLSAECGRDVQLGG